MSAVLGIVQDPLSGSNLDTNLVPAVSLGIRVQDSLSVNLDTNLMSAVLGRVQDLLSGKLDTNLVPAVYLGRKIQDSPKVTWTPISCHLSILVDGSRTPFQEITRKSFLQTCNWSKKKRVTFLKQRVNLKFTPAVF